MSARVSGRRGAYRLLWWHERDERAKDGATYLRLRGDATNALAFARAFVSVPPAVAAIRALLARDLVAVHRLDDDHIIEALATRLAGGRIFAERLASGPLLAFDIHEGKAEPAAAGADTAKSQPKTWIEIELVNTEGNPVPNERYWIELPDGSVREGRLNGEGRAYFGGLDPGDCDVRWPNLDGQAFAAPGEPVQPRKRQPPPERTVVKKTWVEFELLGMDDSPIANEKYRIKLPTGEILEGKLDDMGYVRVDDLDPGTCSISFPDLDTEAWKPI